MDLANTDIQVEKVDRVCTIALNRPKVKNALNGNVIKALTNAITGIAADNKVQLVKFISTSTDFCAGADINWMKASMHLSEADNKAEAMQLAHLFHAIYYLPKITMAVVTGRTFGGGIGLLAACDYVFADVKSEFSFSEVKLGLVPATIAPYVIKRTGGLKARQLMLSGEVFSVLKAAKIGLVDKVYNKQEQLFQEASDFINSMLTLPLSAQTNIKKLVQQIEGKEIDSNMLNYTSSVIAKSRTSKNGQEGMQAFLGKRKPVWKL